MDAIKAARELGRAIQQDSRFISYNTAKLNNDEDEELQVLIGEFNLTRQNLQLEMSKNEDERNSEKIEQINKKMQAEYATIMSNENMAKFTVAKEAVDKLIREVNQIIGLCCEGEDPDTCQPSDCTGSCGTCGGCG